jgi:hypothetical protein
MSVRKNLTLSDLFLAILLAAAQPAHTAEPEQSRVLSVMQAIADAWNRGGMPASSYFEPSLTVVDDTPPYLFQGPNAVADWIAAYRSEQPKSSKNAKTTLRLLQPTNVEITGARAFVAVPADWTAEQDGKRDVEHGVITATLDRPDRDWRIAAWVWTPR